MADVLLKDVVDTSSSIISQSQEPDFSIMDVLEDGGHMKLCEALKKCFEGENMEKETSWSKTVIFLEEALTIAKHKQEAAAHEKSSEVTEKGLITLTRVPTIVPRGKSHEIVFGETDLVIQGKGYNILTPYTNIDCMIKLPEYEAITKSAVHKFQYVLRLKSPVNHRKTKLTYLSFCIGVGDAKKDENVLFNLQGTENDFKNAKLHEITDKLLESMTSNYIIRTFPEVGGKRFISTNGGPYVKCYRRTNPGVLFFLPHGLCFLNPPLFLSRGEIDSISWSREASDALKSFDVTVEHVDGSKTEFSMLEKEEIPSITSFVQYFRQLRDADERVKLETTETKEATTTGLSQNPNDDDDDDEADSDFEMEDEDEDDEWNGSESLSERENMDTDTDDDNTRPKKYRKRSDDDDDDENSNDDDDDENSNDGDDDENSKDNDDDEEKEDENDEENSEDDKYDKCMI